MTSPTTTSRRDFLIASGATLALSTLPADAAQTSDAKAEAALADMAEQMLADYPESATSLGIDKDARAVVVDWPEDF